MHQIVDLIKENDNFVRIAALTLYLFRATIQIRTTLFYKNTFIRT